MTRCWSRPFTTLDFLGIFPSTTFLLPVNDLIRFQSFLKVSLALVLSSLKCSHFAREQSLVIFYVHWGCYHAELMFRRINSFKSSIVVPFVAAFGRRHYKKKSWKVHVKLKLITDSRPTDRLCLHSQIREISWISYFRKKQLIK